MQNWSKHKNTFLKLSCLVIVGQLSIQIILRNVGWVCTIFPWELYVFEYLYARLSQLYSIRHGHCCCCSHCFSVLVFSLLLLLECNSTIYPLQVVKEGSGSAASAVGSMVILTFLVYSRSRLKTAWRNFTSWDFCPCALLATCTMIWSRLLSTDLPSEHQRFPGMSWPHEAYLFHRKLK